jgi:alpha-tubulin suppressor-like RCC1 family protein
VPVLDAQGQILGNVTRLALGRDFSCALRTDATVWCWGRNDSGELGLADIQHRAVPIQIRWAGGGALTDIVDIQAGHLHTCALDRSGGVACWGTGSEGQLGDGLASTVSEAVSVVGPGGTALTGVVEITVGKFHSCALMRDRTARCWGGNTSGEIGTGVVGTIDNGTAWIPSAFPLPQTGIASISAGAYYTCIAKLDGTLSCFGSAWKNTLGDGNDDALYPEPSPRPVLVSIGGPPIENVARVVAGAVGCLLTTDQAVLCWGKGLYGSTGTGGGALVPTPVLGVGDVPLTGVTRLISDNAHPCAHLDAGYFVCWGRNIDGELMNGLTEHLGRATPVTLTCP